jgi:2-C-methyl-D-erythritol 4-phosphate cytidylyltransferase
MFKKKQRNIIPAAAVIVAGGNSTRMGQNVDKKFALICGKPLLAFSLESFSAAQVIKEIVIVTNPKDILPVKNLVRDYKIDKIVAIVPGGETRQESVFCGLKEIKNEKNADSSESKIKKVVLIHDGARPFISPRKIDEIASFAYENSPATYAIEATDTMKTAKNDNDIKLVDSEIDRENLWRIQTPQAFPLDLIKYAHVRARLENFAATDDASLVKNIGGKVAILKGSRFNIKVTYPQDIIFAEAIARYLDVV